MTCPYGSQFEFDDLNRKVGDMTREEFEERMENNRTDLALMALQYGYMSHESGKSFDETKDSFLKIWKNIKEKNATKSTEYPGE
jgi:hypothetical protein